MRLVRFVSCTLIGFDEIFLFYYKKHFPNTLRLNFFQNDFYTTQKIHLKLFTFWYSLATYK